MSASVTVSERAAKRIGEILKGEPAGTMLRVSVEGGGCSGFQYKFDMERAKAADGKGYTMCPFEVPSSPRYPRVSPCSRG